MDAGAPGSPGHVRHERLANLLCSGAFAGVCIHACNCQGRHISWGIIWSLNVPEEAAAGALTSGDLPQHHSQGVQVALPRHLRAHVCWRRRVQQCAARKHICLCICRVPKKRPTCMSRLARASMQRRHASACFRAVTGQQSGHGQLGLAVHCLPRQDHLRCTDLPAPPAGLPFLLILYLTNQLTATGLGKSILQITPRNGGLHY